MATEKLEQEVKQSRKVIQISTSTTNTGQVIVTALCNDGTMWFRVVTSEYGDWHKVKAI